ncbi:Dihydroceramide fatty acyl 2-hydroxylase FAH1-like protein [Drosera capensis]
MVAKDFTVDLNKPLVFQVGHLGEAYEEWPLTLAKWWVIPLIWLPVASWFILSSIQRGLSPQSTMMTVVCGIFVWSIVEYMIHRFIFHMKTTSYWGEHIALLYSLTSPQASYGFTATCFSTCSYNHCCYSALEHS